MIERDDTVDLLTLIGRTIERLQKGIELFEEDDRTAGLKHLSAVIEEIDAYLGRASEDPLLRLAGLPEGEVAVSLSDVKSDISSVIADLRRTKA
ncbi:hypothetical protein DRJ24_05470 [Candidatus Acetothermia bacterium]|nr:MAG: hypothetical protein DRJ24_05470 [Candidatus Acetothermia bacterium]